MCKISVIIPAYNVEKYITKCIHSVIAQSFENFEVVLVDDGSTDGTSLLCDEFGKKDNRISVYHKLNGGLSDARNYGIERAKGEYICFIDSDDYISKDYLQLLYNGIENYEVQISMISHKRVKEKESDELNTYRTEKYEICSAKEAVDIMLQQRGFSHVAVAKLFKKELWESIRFPVGQNYEDYATIYRIFALCTSVSLLREEGYFYVQRSGSIMNSKCSKKTLSVLDVSEASTEFIIKKWPDLKVSANDLQVSVYLKNYQLIKNSGMDCFTEEERRISNFVKANALFLLAAPKTRKKTKVKLALFMINKRLFCTVNNIIDEKE